MYRSVLLTAIAALFVFAAVWSSAGEVGAIKKFVRFPADTFELSGRRSPTTLDETTTPLASTISVDGWWPDKKLLLISFGGESYYVHYRAVEMVDQRVWDTRMQASGGLVCLGRRTGGDPNSSTAASKGFSNPC